MRLRGYVLTRLLLAGTQHDTGGAPCKHLNIRDLTAFRVIFSSTLKTAILLIYNHLRDAPHPCRLAEVSEAEQWRQIHILPLSVNLITSKVASVKLFTILANKEGGAHYENNFQAKRMKEMLRRWYHRNYI